MQIRKLNNAFEFDFTFCGRRIRRTIDADELVHFLEGGNFSDPDANLPPGKEIISFIEFIERFYLPLHSKMNKKPNVYETDRVSAKALCRFFGDMPIHAIQAKDWEEYKRLRMAGPVPVNCKKIAEELRSRTDRRLSPERPVSTWTLNREMSCLNQAMDFAVRLQYIVTNTIKGAKRLPTESRKSFWLKKGEIEAYLNSIPGRIQGAYPDQYRDFAEFLILTGARIREALPFNRRDLDESRHEIALITLKKKRKRDKVYRYLSIDSLGRRLDALLKRLKPHPQTGYYFHRPNGDPLPYGWIRTRLLRGARKAGLEWFRPHDSRHTFAMHRAIVVRDFRQLQTELGHEDPISVQSYLDSTSRFQLEDSIFYAAKKSVGAKKA